MLFPVAAVPARRRPGPLFRGVEKSDSPRLKIFSKNFLKIFRDFFDLKKRRLEEFELAGVAEVFMGDLG